MKYSLREVSESNDHPNDKRVGIPEARARLTRLKTSLIPDSRGAAWRETDRYGEFERLLDLSKNADEQGFAMMLMISRYKCIKKIGKIMQNGSANGHHKPHYRFYSYGRDDLREGLPGEEEIAAIQDTIREEPLSVLAALDRWDELESKLEFANDDHRISLRKE